PVERAQQNASLGAGAAAELDYPAVRADLRRHLVGVCFENGDLGARQVVLGQTADRFEKCRAACVVEEFARDGLARSAEPAQDSVAKAFLAGCQVVEGETRAAGHPTSSASRNPENAHRAEAGKKLR